MKRMRRTTTRSRKADPVVRQFCVMQRFGMLARQSESQECASDSAELLFGSSTKDEEREIERDAEGQRERER